MDKQEYAMLEAALKAQAQRLFADERDQEKAIKLALETAEAVDALGFEVLLGMATMLKGAAAAKPEFKRGLTVAADTIIGYVEKQRNNS